MAIHPQPKPEPRARTKGREKRQKAKTTAEIRQYVFARERNICRCCRKRVADSMHEILPRGRGGKISKWNSIALCGDGVRGCHGFCQRYEITIGGDPHLRAEGELRFMAQSLAAAQWMAIEQYRTIESPVMHVVEADE